MRWYEEARLLFKQMLTGPVKHSRNCSNSSCRNMRGGNQALAQVPEIQGVLESLDPSAGPPLALTGGFDFF